jgi:heptaprenyl diphosphate synthase
VLESLIPLPLPFLKIGIANISTLLALLSSGAADALIVVLIRILAGSLLTGAFLGPAFLIALSAGIVSAAGMSAVRALTGKLFGPVGLSLIGSSLHVTTQLGVVALLYVRNEALVSLLPLLLFTALCGGVVVGLAASRLLPPLAPPAMNAADPGLRETVRMKMADRIALVGLPALIAGSLLLGGGSSGTTVLVDVHDRTVARLDLRIDSEVMVAGEHGALRVQTQGGRVRVAEADCPNHICVRTGWRSRAGEVIVCVPNRVVIRILGAPPEGIQGVTG